MRRLRIIGPPGTGKTTTLINLVADLIKEGYEPSSVLAISFTRAGRRAIREKVSRILRPQRLIKRRSELHYLGRTIHSVAKELLGIPSRSVLDARKLRRFCETYGYQITLGESSGEEDEIEYRDTMLVTPEDYYLHFLDWARHRRYPTFESAIAYFMHQYQEDLPFGFSLSGLRLFIQRYEEFKKEEELWDFTDFLLGVIKERLAPQGVKVLAVDECQDLSPLLWEIVNWWSIGTRCEVFIIAGDPLQAIYEFSGADSSIMMNWPATEEIFIEESHRVPAKVFELDRRVMTSLRCWYKQDYKPRDEEGFVEGIYPVVLDKVIEEHMGERIYVIARTRMLCTKINEILMGFGVPFKALRGVKSPAQGKALELAQLLLKISRGEKVPIETFADLVGETSLIPSADYLKHGAKKELVEFAERNPGYEIGKENLPAFGFNMEFIKRIEEGRILEVMKLSDEERKVLERALKEDLPDVTVGTIHAFKGEEADIVILADALTRRTYTNYLKNPQEEGKCFHVGITRARKGLYILRGISSLRFELL